MLYEVITSGNVIFADFHAARLFAEKINQKRDLVNYPEQAVKAGQINEDGHSKAIGAKGDSCK